MDEKSTVNQRFIKAVNYLIEIKFAKNKTEIAFNLRLSKSKLSEILNERMNVPIDTIAFISLFYGISANWLLNDKGLMLESEVSTAAKGLDPPEGINYKELAEARLEIIEGLKFKVNILEKELYTLKEASQNPVLYKSVAEPTPELSNK